MREKINGSVSRTLYDIFRGKGIINVEKKHLCWIYISFGHNIFSCGSSLRNDDRKFLKSWNDNVNTMSTLNTKKRNLKLIA